MCPIPSPQAYTFSAPAGVVGDVTRPDESNVEPAQLVPVGGSTYPSAYGIPMQYVVGGIQQINTGSETAASFAGILIREVPSISGGIADDAAAPPAGGSPWANNTPSGLLVRGYACVKCIAGTPARGGVVYMQVTAHLTANPGDLRADGTDSGNAVALTAAQAEWASDGVDSNLVAEIRVAR